MKTNKIYSIIAVCFLLLATNCAEDQVDPNQNVIFVENQPQSTFDKYLSQIYTKPYNIRFIYKWDDNESDMNYDLVPANYENSVKMANLVKYLCLDSYQAVAPKNFLKKYFPKNIMLVGSPAYRNNGTIVLGTAEGGVKITLYNINNLDTKDVEGLYRLYFRTIFHEFSHILHQTKYYSKDFQKICEKDYVGEVWNEAWGTDKEKGLSLESGFISDYSSKDPNEDFVELIAHYVTYTPERWQKTLEAAGDEGRSRLEQKIDIVKKYLSKVWSIDIDALRAEVLSRANNLDNVDLMNINTK